MKQLGKINRRCFLGKAPSLMCMNFDYKLWQYTMNLSGGSEEHISHMGRLSLFLRNKVIVIHENDLVKTKESLDDFIRKLSLIRGTIKNALDNLDTFLKDRTFRYIDKQFLNDIEGCSDIYTSTIAITMSETHGVTFEIGSCDHKSRISLHGHRAPKSFFGKFYSELNKVVKELEEIRDKNNEALTQYGV